MAEREPTRRGPDVVTLIAGVLTLLVSGYVLTDGAIWIPSMDGRWPIAGGAVLIGVLLLVAGGRRGRRR